MKREIEKIVFLFFHWHFDSYIDVATGFAYMYSLGT